MFKLFSKAAIGLEITNSAINIVELAADPGGSRVVSAGHQTLPAGVVAPGEIKDKQKLISALRAVAKEAKPRAILPKPGLPVIVGWPEENTFGHFVSRHEAGGHDGAWTTVVREAKRNIPLPPEDLIIDYKILNRYEDGTVEYLIVGASRQLVSQWREVFAILGWSAIFEPAVAGLYRGIFDAPPAPPAGVVLVGEPETTLAIFDQAGLRYSCLINFSPGDKKSWELLGDEVATTLKYFNESAAQPVGKVILTGDLALAAGLGDYLAQKIAAPIVADESGQNKTKEKNYLTAVGLARRGLGENLGLNLTFNIDQELDEPERRPFKWRRLVWLAVAVAVIGLGLTAWRFFTPPLKLDNEPMDETRPVVSDEPFPPAPVVATPVKDQIIVTETPTGWLNVRTEPNTASEILRQVNPGEIYPLLATSTGWYKIKVQDGEGWISSDYANIIDN